MVTVLGIESTAHTFGVGIVRDGKVLANVRDMYTTNSGGIIPMEAAKHHAKIAQAIFDKALHEAGIEEKEIDAIAFSSAPGLAPCLLEGMKFAKELVKQLNRLHYSRKTPPITNSDRAKSKISGYPSSKEIPLIPVNHCVAHLEIGRLVGAKNPVMLYVSGANTQVISYEGKKFRIFGETLDLGVGNFLDTLARFMGLGFPGGPKLEVLAKEGKTYIELPYTVKGMDFTLSGMQTKVKRLISQKISFEDLAFSVQETVFAMLVEVVERALAHTNKKELLLAGGVSCNARLQEMCCIMCQERGAKLFVPLREFLVDNGAMIAYLGEIMYNAGMKSDVKTLDIAPRERTDDVDVFWRR